MAIYCYKCGSELILPPGQVSRGAECDKCKSDARVCKNCQHYDPAAYNECRERQAERVLDKERSNMCDYFHLAQDRKPGAKNNQAKDKALSALDDLFKK